MAAALCFRSYLIAGNIKWRITLIWKPRVVSEVSPSFSFPFKWSREEMIPTWLFPLSSLQQPSLVWRTEQDVLYGVTVCYTSLLIDEQEFNLRVPQEAQHRIHDRCTYQSNVWNIASQRGQLIVWSSVHCVFHLNWRKRKRLCNAIRFWYTQHHHKQKSRFARRNI